ncbi:MAG: succinylglutamate desuccinylase/aspartoacylase family protein [Verrucomicrobiaceae bacterium]
MNSKAKRESFVLGDVKVEPGTKQKVDLPIGVFTNNTAVDLGVVVVHGRRPGPTLLVTACIHGDEINGLEIIRRILRSSTLKNLRGTLLAVPIINVPAFLNRSRYLPDRRDLNRLFPGSEKGSLGARLARVITTELITRCDAVIDLHTGAVNRANLPQIRTTSGDEKSLMLATTFGSPVALTSNLRPGSFRATCHENGKPMILFESGEALRLDAPSIRFGKQGVISVMRHLHMLPARKSKNLNPDGRSRKTHTVVCEKSYWERAPIGGVFTPLVALGQTVERDEVLGFVADPFGGDETPIVAARQGVLIGRTNEGVADEGDALFHIAVHEDLNQARDGIARSNSSVSGKEDHPVPYDPFMEAGDSSDDD